MFEWIIPDDHGFLSLVAAGCLLVALAHTTLLPIASALPTAKRRPGLLSTPDSIPALDGDGLYYDRTQWPQYEPRFNLRLSSLYGPVIRVETGPKNWPARLFRWLNRCLHPAWRPSDTTILVNSLAGDDGTLKKLLNACASRATSIAAGSHLSRGRRIVLQPYGPDWARHRKAFSSLLTRDKIKSHWTKALRFEAMVLVDRVAGLAAASAASETAWLVDEISRFTASSVLQITYARRARTPEDPVLADLETVSKNIGNAFTPGRYWVEQFPVLEYLPALISPWKRRLDADHEFESELFSRLLQGVEEKMRPGADFTPAADVVISVEECAAAQLLDSQESHQLDRDYVAYLAAGLFEAGTETTAMTINAFLLAAACYPEHIRRAQAEMDDHMRRRYGAGTGAVPVFEDLEQLPRLAALVKEALRLTPTGSSGVGHTPTSGKPMSFTWIHDEEEHKQHHQEQQQEHPSPQRRLRLDVPARATVLANIYGLHHDAAVYRDPWRFDPDRWLAPPPRVDDAGAAAASSRDAPGRQGSRSSLDHTHATHAFGYGRRICPGAALASYSLSMAIALLLLCFDVELRAEAARGWCAEMEAQVGDECGRWMDLFGEAGRRALEREQASREDYEDERDRLGRVLLDAYITFKLSRGQLAQCVCLKPRKDDKGLRAVRDALSTMVK